MNVFEQGGGGGGPPPFLVWAFFFPKIFPPFKKFSQKNFSIQFYTLLNIKIAKLCYLYAFTYKKLKKI